MVSIRNTIQQWKSACGQWVKSTLNGLRSHANQTTIPRDAHPIALNQISPNALKVLRRLHQAGFQAFLVGGGVRDLLLGRAPKDFDVATNATPEQIKKLFGNARLVGKRFLIAHVQYAQEIIEVATFRRTSQHTRNSSGLLITDNQYGSQEEDAYRRDFTGNAIYFDISNCSLIDYTGGMRDIRKRMLRLIGDPETRYREDPVRMLRAARLSAKLDLGIERATEACIPTLAPLLTQISHARLADELAKIFLKGHAVKSLQILQKTRLFPVLFPATAAGITRHPMLQGFLEKALALIDTRVQNRQGVTIPFLYACLLWPAIYPTLQPTSIPYKNLLPLLHSNLAEVITQQNQITQISRFYGTVIRDILELHIRLATVHRQAARKLGHHPKFKMGWDFLAIRAEAGDPDVQHIADWWRQWMNNMPVENQEAWLKKLPVLRTKRRRKPRSSAKTSPAAEPGTGTGPAPEPSAPPGDG